MPVTNIVHPDGRIVRREWEPGLRPNLNWLQRAVAGPDQEKGWIELLLDDEQEHVLAFGNEEGRLINMPANVLAMKTIGWPPPPEGWDAYTGHMGDQPMFKVYTSHEEFMAARGTTWCPVVGPVVLVIGFEPVDDEGEYVETGCNPDDLGIEYTAAREGAQT